MERRGWGGLQSIEGRNLRGFTLQWLGMWGSVQSLRVSGRTPSPWRLLLLFSGIVLVLLPAPGTVRAQEAAAPDSGCVLYKDVYTCNWHAFRQALAGAQTVAVETQPHDRFTAAQLRELIRSLGKTAEPATGAADHPADLIFLLIPMDAGIYIGPEDHPLATLRIYAAGPDGSRGHLLWAETLRGQGDHPWPSQVHALIEQFQDRLPKHGDMR